MTPLRPKGFAGQAEVRRQRTKVGGQKKLPRKDADIHGRIRSKKLLYLNRQVRNDLNKLNENNDLNDLNKRGT